MRQFELEEFQHYVKQFTGESTLARVPQFDDFAQTLIAEMMPKLVRPGEWVSVTELAHLLIDLYREAVKIAYTEDKQRLERFLMKEMRPARVKWDRAYAHVHHALALVRKARDSMPRRDAEQLVPGLLQFEPVLKSLSELEQRLGDLQQSYAAIIHPELRTSTERRQAAASQHKFHHTEFPMTPKSATLKYELVKRLEHRLYAFQRKMPQAHVNRIIVEVLTIALGWHDTVDNIKTMRRRNKENILPRS